MPSTKPIVLVIELLAELARVAAEPLQLGVNEAADVDHQVRLYAHHQQHPMSVTGSSLPPAAPGAP
jgi:hypothetical protein